MGGSIGFLCGLFMCHHLNWRVVGYYDGKILAIEEAVKPRDCVFLDVDIFRKEIASVGHHMVLFNKRQMPENWEQFDSCLQPNILRGYDFKQEFRLKYPLATIHLLLSIIGVHLKVQLPASALHPLLFTDGTYNVLFSYPENVLQWLDYLNVGSSGNPLKSVLMNTSVTVHELMKGMDGFFAKRNLLNVKGMRGDQLKLSSTSGGPINVDQNGKTFCISPGIVALKSEFLQLLASGTGWRFNESNWTWNGLVIRQFSKSNFTGQKRRLNGTTFMNLLEKNPLSWAITAGNELEYTLEEPDSIA